MVCRWTSLAVACAACLVMVAGCGTGPKAGSPAPAFSATDSAGQSISLADFEGGVLILDFWAVW
ncbi:MAG: TlpA family protein disulfide reductase [Planctomycetota bacterium]